MTTNLLKYALRQHFTERARKVLEEEVDKLLEDWYMVDEQNPGDAIANERIAVLSGLKMALENIVGENVSAETFKVRLKTETSYLPSDDITLVWNDLYVYDECIQWSLAGWHYGETDPETTEKFSYNPTIANFLF